jgi:hypothetical protein
MFLFCRYLPDPRKSPRFARLNTNRAANTSLISSACALKYIYQYVSWTLTYLSCATTLIFRILNRYRKPKLGTKHPRGRSC